MNNYPKILFKYSSVYDQKWRRGELGGEKRGKDYPSPQEVLKYIKIVEEEWEKEKDKILPEISKITGLPWQENYIYCYIVGRCRPFPFPLTLPIYTEDVQDFIDVLTHELIHRFFVPETTKSRVGDAWDYSNQKYREESRVTRMHILVYAIHSAIYFKFFGEERILNNIKRIKSRPDYKRAWEIVQKEGYKNIINDFQRMVL